MTLEKCERADILFLVLHSLINTNLEVMFNGCIGNTLVLEAKCTVDSQHFY